MSDWANMHAWKLRTVRCLTTVLITQNNATPRTCVAITMHSACSTGLGLLIHLGFVVPSLSSFSDEAPSRAQPALTHSYRPANIIATLMMTALGKKLPILRKVVGPVMI